jgi:hypothetical protein
MEDFSKIVESEQSGYIIIESKSLTLQVIPFYSLPARYVTELYSKKKDTHKFINKLYFIISIAMYKPEDFQEKVYNAPLSYEDLFDFLNSWIKTSNVIRRYKNGEIDDNGEPTVKTIMQSVDIYEFRMLESMRKDEPISAVTMIRYLSEHIKRIAANHNETARPDSKIYQVLIDVEINK